MRINIRVLFMFLSLLGFANYDAFAQADDTTNVAVLTYEAYMDLVRTHHPVAIQSELQLQKGEAEIMKARGAFDPKASAKVAEKYFKDNQYYSLNDFGLKVPTWFGIEAKAGYEENHGKYLNPEHSTSGAGLWYGGISVPVGKGLFIDKRRAELQQAKVYQQSTEAQRRAMLNQLQYEAGKAYWDWFVAYHAVQVYEEGLVLIKERLQAVKESVVYGDKAAIDTLEAGIQVQNRQVSLQQAQLEYANAMALLSVYLWSEGNIPLEVSSATIPPLLGEAGVGKVSSDFNGQFYNMIEQHPELQQYEYKVATLSIEQRLKKENLKPDLNLNYYALNKAVGNDPLYHYSSSNYKWGLDFSIPLFLRKDRGALKLANLKIQEAELSWVQKKAQLTYKANAAVNEWNNTFDQVQVYQNTVRDYGKLVDGERQKYTSGESSLFLVNYRENSYINAKNKLIQMIAKNKKAEINANYALAGFDLVLEE